MSRIRFKCVIMCGLIACMLGGTVPRSCGRSGLRAERLSVIELRRRRRCLMRRLVMKSLLRRRARVGQAIGPKATLILFSTMPRVYTGDVDYEYRQENNLYYLTNLKQRRATLVLTPSNELFPAILFLPRRRPQLKPGPATCTPPKKRARFPESRRYGKQVNLNRSEGVPKPSTLPAKAGKHSDVVDCGNSRRLPRRVLKSYSRLRKRTKLSFICCRQTPTILNIARSNALLRSGPRRLPVTH